MFSKQLLTQPDYDNNLGNYINKHLKIQEYKITEEEFGVIPMTNYRFPKSQHRIVNMGTAGGQTKASTGLHFYVLFKNIQLQSWTGL